MCQGKEEEDSIEDNTDTSLRLLKTTLKKQNKKRLITANEKTQRSTKQH